MAVSVFKENLTEKYGIKVERSVQKSRTNGVDYRDYFIRYNVRGRETLIHFLPADSNAQERYARVDDVFVGVDYACLIVETQKDDETGRSFENLTIYSEDADGFIVEAKMRYKNRSDGDVLKSMIENIKRKQAKEAEAKAKEQASAAVEDNKESSKK